MTTLSIACSPVSSRRGLRVVAVLCTLGTWLLLAGNARAGDDDADQARAYHERAKAAFALSHYGQAAEFFEKAFELKSDPALLYNAAQSHRLAGDKERALNLYQNYLHVYGRDDRRAQIELRIDELKKAIERDRKEIPAKPPATWPPGTVPPPGSSTGVAPQPQPQPMRGADVLRPAPAATAPPPVVEPAPPPPSVMVAPAPPAAGAAPPMLLTRNGSSDGSSAETEPSLTQKPWFWIAVGGGVAAAAAVVLVLVLSGSKDPTASFGQAHGN
jgi:hypothetical protein